jgi:hypothetical protein
VWPCGGRGRSATKETVGGRPGGSCGCSLRLIRSIFLIGNGQTSGVRHVLANHRVLTYPYSPGFIRVKEYVMRKLIGNILS